MRRSWKLSSPQSLAVVHATDRVRSNSRPRLDVLPALWPLLADVPVALDDDAESAVAVLPANAQAGAPNENLSEWKLLRA